LRFVSAVVVVDDDVAVVAIGALGKVVLRFRSLGFLASLLSLVRFLSTDFERI